MKVVALFTALLLVSPCALAQSSTVSKRPEILSKPACSALVNMSDVTIQGTLGTAPQRAESGDMVTLRDNFKLAPGERRSFCSTGPFYPGQRLALTIRTLIPLFECKTKIDREIRIYSDIGLDDSRTYSANCR